MHKGLPSTTLLGVPIHAITEEQCIATILESLHEGKGGWVVTPNLDILRRCKRDDPFRRLLNGADMIVPDGMPLIWASYLRRTPLPERIAGSTLVTTLSTAAARDQRRIFLLGGAPGSAKAAATRLQLQVPEIDIAGTHCPPIGFESSKAEMQQIERVLRQSTPDIVYVGLGSPKQEYLIDHMRHVLPSAWWLGVGVSFSFLCGDIPRAPVWMQRLGFEWAHRLIQEPGRLARRYLVHGLPFAVQLFTQSAWEGITLSSSTAHARKASSSH